ncbi:hypothetical protein IT570_07320 [Candidatus Sumerlaeota bacterium]|nr:hypothetical protein [Candidatus Sumerlaeota bacterium]
MRRILPSLFAAAMTIAAIQANAQELHTMLSPEQEQQLSPEAAVFYRQADVAEDHINYDEAVRLLAKAAEIDVKNSDLQFLAASRARIRAEVYYSEATFSAPPANMDYSTPPWQTAEQYLNIAEASLNRIAANAELPAEQRTRLKAAQAMLDARRSALADRDKARIEAAKPVYDYYRETRYQALLDNLPADAQIGDDEVSERIVKAMGLAGVKVVTAKGQELVPPTTDASKNVDKIDPFAVLPGEYTPSFLPPPPQPQGGYVEGAPAPGAIDPFANPAPAPADPAMGGGGFK